MKEMKEECYLYWNGSWLLDCDTYHKMGEQCDLDSNDTDWVEQEDKDLLNVPTYN